ncbi:fimbria/pilus outer membrane usher protein [Enterobacter cloacae]|uniref:fimbria/pilus outer membrane usher protein n=1 Tax=Enterobacter cloacae TaxID=550 RepID=UPI002972E1D7|nr:fimbrial biogenesis outer membrane usher protein [Enterobacter cloacae]
MKLQYILIFTLLAFSDRSAIAGKKTQIIINDALKGSVNLDFVDNTPCLTRPLLEEWGVKKKIIEHVKWTSKLCITEISAKQYALESIYDSVRSELILNIPPEFMNAQQNGVLTSRWDNGINAAFLNYRLDIDHTHPQSSSENGGTEGSLVLENGINFGPWRLRHQTNFWRERDGNHGSYSSNISFWRSLTSLRARLNIGDGHSQPSFFNSIPFRGISLYSDGAMFPDSWRNYAPQINGYARSEAEVTIHQNGERVYRMLVPPGPFTIRDFYPPYAQGNLEMTVQESDGTERTHWLPWSLMPNLVQHGIVTYDLTYGQYHPSYNNQYGMPIFWQSGLSWGIAPQVTVFSGFQQSEAYQSVVFGAGKNLGEWGAFSTDISTAFYHEKKTRHHGNVWRMRYAKAFFKSETSINAQLLWYPPASQYRTLEDKIHWANAYASFGEDGQQHRAIQSKLELTQNFNEDSNLSLSWQWEKGHGTGHSSSFTSLNLNTTWKNIDVSLYGRYEHRAYEGASAMLGLNFSVPFSIGGHTSNVAWLSDLNNRTASSQGVNLYGSVLEDASLSYDISGLRNSHGESRFASTLGYQYNAGEATFSVDHSSQYQRYHGDASGSIMLHKDGITLGQPLGNAMALVDVPDTPDIGFYNQFGSITDARGQLLVSYLTPWRVNRITVDGSTLPDGSEMAEEELEAVPTDGAIIRLRFPKPVMTK